MKQLKEDAIEELGSNLFKKVKKNSDYHKKDYFTNIFDKKNKRDVYKSDIIVRINKIIKELNNGENVIKNMINIFKLYNGDDDDDSSLKTKIEDVFEDVFEDVSKKDSFRVVDFIENFKKINYKPITLNKDFGLNFIKSLPQIRKYIDDETIYLKHDDIKNNDNISKKEGDFIENVKDILKIDKDYLKKRNKIYESMKNKKELVESEQKNKDLEQAYFNQNEKLKNTEDLLKNTAEGFKIVYDKVEDVGKKVDDIKKGAGGDISPSVDINPLSHMLNKTRLKRVHDYLNKGFGDLPRDKAINKIYDELLKEKSKEFSFANDEELKATAESLADAVLIRKGELSHKYRPAYEKLRTLNDMNMIDSLPEEAAKQLNQMDLEKYYADQKKIDKIYILPKEWQRISTATTQYNINPMLLRGVIKDK